MEALAVLVLVGLSFAFGTLITLVWYFASPSHARPKILAVASIPFAFALIPVVLAILAPRFEKSDHALYQEIFGFPAIASEQAMLFDHFSSGQSREIYMVIYANEEEHERILSITGLTPSNTTINQFARLGDRHGFTWWASADPNNSGYCKSARFLEADGFRGWSKLRISECLDAANGILQPNNSRIHVMALR